MTISNSILIPTFDKNASLGHDFNLTLMVKESVPIMRKRLSIELGQLELRVAQIKIDLNKLSRLESAVR